MKKINTRLGLLALVLFLYQDALLAAGPIITLDQNLSPTTYGTATYVWTANGPGVPPTWQAGGGGGSSACTVTGTVVAGVEFYGTGPGTCGIFVYGSALQLNQSGGAPIDFPGATMASGLFANAVTAAGGLNGAYLSAVPTAKTSSYQLLNSDFYTYATLPFNCASACTATLVASGSQPANGQSVSFINYGAAVTIARSGQNINGGTASLVMQPGSATAPSFGHVVSDATNYEASVSYSPVSSGTITINPGAVGSGSCTNTTASATGAVAGNQLDLTFGDLSAVTGYSGIGTLLTVYKYVTSNTVNVKVCNWTGASITPTSTTANWEVRQ